MNTPSHPRWTTLGAAFLLALLALFAPGCKSRDDVEALAGRLKGNFRRWTKPSPDAAAGKVPDLKGGRSEDHFLGRDGPTLATLYFVDKKRTRETTVRQTLIDLGASLADGKVVALDGRELYFCEVSQWDEDPKSQSPDLPTPEQKFEHLGRHYHVVLMYIGKPGNPALRD